MSKCPKVKAVLSHPPEAISQLPKDENFKGHLEMLKEQCLRTNS
jgi:hypothetical protein